MLYKWLDMGVKNFFRVHNRLSIYQVNALNKNAAICKFPIHELAKSVWYLKIWSRDLGVPDSTSKKNIQIPSET